MRWPALTLPASLVLVVALALVAAFGVRGQDDAPTLGKAATWSLGDDAVPTEEETAPLRLGPSMRSALDSHAVDRAIDPERLARARAHLGPGARTRSLGRHELVTDVPEGELLELLDTLVAATDDAYARKLGLPVAQRAFKAAVVLFASEKSYADLAEEETALPAEVRFFGHAGGGVATLFVGDRGDREVGSTLVHELTHLLNAQVLGPELPLWLDEGLALYLATARISRRGILDPDHVEWLRVPLGGGYRGPADFLGRVARSYRGGQAPPLEALAALDRASFFAGGDPRSSVYCWLWIRFLLGSNDPLLGQGFRRHLSAFTTGEPPAFAALLAELGRSPEELEDAFLLWLEQARQHRELGVG